MGSEQRVPVRRPPYGGPVDLPCSLIAKPDLIL